MNKEILQEICTKHQFHIFEYFQANPTSEQLPDCSFWKEVDPFLDNDNGHGRYFYNNHVTVTTDLFVAKFMGVEGGDKWGEAYVKIQIIPLHESILI